MKKVIKIFICISMTLIMTVSYASCALFAKKYTVSYSDERGLHKITATVGKTYAFKEIPEKIGYEFLGLFDAETGGVQYVSEEGKSLKKFQGKADLVLYPQYKAKEYVIILDYQGAELAGSRSITVTYGQELSSLPENLVYEDKTFVGWFTEADCEGVCVYDNYGAVPLVSIVNEKNFDLENQIYLYAGFTTKMCTVKFDFGDEMNPEILTVPVHTSLARIAPTTKNTRELGVLSWGKSKDVEEIFSGEILEDMVLYAKEWAPVLELDENGGEERKDIIAKVGTTILLPLTQKKGYQFMGWKQLNGGIVKDDWTMPANSTTLTAVWQAYIFLDENGGTETQDISQSLGSTLVLPNITKDGYLLAGWFTEEGEKYTATTMPEESISLKAGWYKTKTAVKVLINASTEMGISVGQPTISACCLQLDLSDILGDNESMNVLISGTLQTKCTNDRLTNGSIGFYRRDTISADYLLSQTTFDIPYYSYQQRTFNASWVLDNQIVYVCMYTNNTISNKLVRDFSVVITYPDIAAGVQL